MSEETIKLNADKVKAVSKRLFEVLTDEFEEERPDIALMGILDAALMIVQVFNPEGGTVENLDSIMDVIQQMRVGEAKCNQKGCEDPATHWYVWPTDGERKNSCAKHTQAAVTIGHTLGYAIQAHPFRVSPSLVKTDAPPESMGG